MNVSNSSVKTIDPVPHKTTIAIINMVTLRTSEFINRYSDLILSHFYRFYNEVEGKLIVLDQRIERLDTLLQILEKKLDSIPPELLKITDSTISQPQTTQNLQAPSINTLQQPQQNTQQGQQQQQMTQNTNIQNVNTVNNPQGQQQQVQGQVQQPPVQQEPEVDLEKGENLEVV